MVGNRGLYAPTIRYHEGRFFIICTNVTESSKGAQVDETSHFIISTDDITSNDWTDPVFFDFEGGDPSLFFEDGRAYVQIANAADTSIHQFEIDVTTGRKLSNSTELLPHSGRKWAESPHIYKRGSYYYLLLAEGGCFEHHMISIARSNHLWGPYEPHPRNPILTAFGTSNYVQHVGHADFVEDLNGDWWAVCLGVRKRAGAFVLGRETFLTPVLWQDDEWPVISPVTMDCVPRGLQTHKLVINGKPKSPLQPFSGFIHIRQKDSDRYIMKEDGDLILRPGLCDLSASHGSVSFAGKCQRSLVGEAKVIISFRSEETSPAHGIRAGLAMFKDEHRFLRIFYDTATRDVCVQNVNKAKEIVREDRKPVDLRNSVTLVMRYSEQSYKLLYRLDDDDDLELLESIEASHMTNLDFVGPVIGVFAVTDGQIPEDDAGLVQFRQFEVA